MSNSREIKRRIQSVKNTQQITKAMKMVSAAKLYKTQATALASRPYTKKLNQVMRKITESLKDSQNPLLQLRPCKKAAVILITGNKGLAGGFNGNLIRLAAELVKDKYQGCEVDFIPVGSKGRDFLRSHEINMPAEFIEISDVPQASETKPVAEFVKKKFLAGDYDAVDMVYQAFLSPGQQEPRVRPLLPLMCIEESTPRPEQSAHVDYLYEPDAASILNTLIPMYIDNMVFQAVLETKAGEFIARLMAMSAATDNAEKMINSLVLCYNRSRQAAITKELSEIMGGANALEQMEQEIE